MKQHKQVFAVWLVAALVFGGISVSAQTTTKALTLKEAIDLSIQNSKLLKGNRAAITAATASLKEVKENRLPDVSFSGAYMYLPVAPTFNLKIKTGTDSTSAGGTPNVKQALYGMASVAMPIYAGGRFKYGIESARYLEEATKLDAETNRQGVIFNTIDAFANLYKAKSAVALGKENLEQSRKRAADFSNLEKNGLLARNDLLKAELQSSNSELALLDAESNYKLATINMDIMLGLPEQTDLVPDTTSLDQAVSLKNIEDYEQLAFQNRKDIEALAFRKKAAAVGVKSAQSEYLPTVALTGGYMAVDVPNLLNAYNIINVGVGVKYSLSSLWKTDAKIQQAKAREQQYAANEEMLRDNVQLQINSVYQQYLLSKKKIDVYAKAVDQAAENYKITKNKYDNSLATLTDLLDADVAQFQAKLNYTFAKTDAVVTYNKLLETAGLL